MSGICYCRQEKKLWRKGVLGPSVINKHLSHQKVILILNNAGFESVEDLPDWRTAVGFRHSSKAFKNLASQLRLSTKSNGEQRVRVLVPNEQRIHLIFYAAVPKSNWLERPRAITREKVQSKGQRIQTLPDTVASRKYIRKGVVSWCTR